VASASLLADHHGLRCSTSPLLTARPIGLVNGMAEFHSYRIDTLSWSPKIVRSNCVGDPYTSTELGANPYSVHGELLCEREKYSVFHKNVAVNLCQWLYQILTDFQNSCIVRLCDKFAIKWYLKIQPHLKRVALYLVKYVFKKSLVSRTQSKSLMNWWCQFSWQDKIGLHQFDNKLSQNQCNNS